MAQTPITPGSVVFIGKFDKNDPESSLNAFLVKPEQDEEGNDEIWIQLGNSFGAEDPAYFIWMVKSMAEFHHLQVQNESGVED